jgi:hypothetical protein
LTIPYYPQTTITPNLGLSLVGMDEVIAEDFILIDAFAGGGGGSTVQVNGSPITNPNFNDTTPAAPSGKTNVKWQVDGSGNVSAYITTGGGGTVPGGADTQMQFNDAGSFGGASDLTWDKVLSVFGMGTQAFNNRYILVTLSDASGTANALFRLNHGASDSSTTVEADINYVGSADLGPVNGPNLTAIYGRADNASTHNVPFQAAVWADAGGNDGGGSVTSNVGVFVSDQHGIGTTNTGIHIADQGTGVNDYAIKVDGGQNDLGPQTTKLGGLAGAYVSKAGNYTTTQNDFAITVAATATITLDSSVAKVGQIYRIKNTGSGIVVTITPSSGNIDNAASATLTTRYSAFDVLFDGTDWWIF